MADPRGFLEVERVAAPERDPRTRTADHHEIFGTLAPEALRSQGRRCMDCGVPLCHEGCPVGNLIPEWNDLVRGGEWRLALGSRVERDVALPGRELAGIHSAMTYLVQRNRAVSGVAVPELTAAGKHVVVIGGGDTAADCVASAHRERAASVTQLDIYPPPAGQRYRELAVWPDFPKRLWSTYALDEGGERRSSFNATAFVGDGHIRALAGDVVGAPPDFAPTGETHELPADLVLIAIGFTGVERGLVDALEVEVGERGTIASQDFQTSARGIFACGDARRGPSLIVWAIAVGRECARAVERYLTAAAAQRTAAA
jgi:glutamate synthase (NADPH/NADH) small chain